MAGFHSNRKKSSSVDEEWREEAPFHAPRIPSTTVGGIRRLRDSLSSKISHTAIAEREFLKKEARYKTPLTQRNIDYFTTQQQLKDACPLERTTEGQVSEWLRQLS
jgi:hypothetical protein